MESIEFEDLLINFTTNFTRIWDDKGAGCWDNATFWRPKPAPDCQKDYYPLGDLIHWDFHNADQNCVIALVSEKASAPGDGVKKPALSKPDDYVLVWNDKNSGAKKNVSIWNPVAPSGYVALGQVCNDSYDKPSINLVRCIRADLVVASTIAGWRWNTRGSNAKQFSVWSVLPPAAVPGEAYFSPGTFISHASFDKPSAKTKVYSLRVKIPFEEKALPPSPPVLPSNLRPADDSPTSITHASSLAWFTVRDPDLSTIEQLQTSPVYRMERTDRYVLTAFGNNTTSQDQTLKWTSTLGESGTNSKTLATATTIEIGAEWQFSVFKSSITISARLSRNLNHTETSSSGWTTSRSFEVTTTLPAKKAIAIYLLRSEYKLLRQDGTQVANDITYINGDKVHWSEYPQKEPEMTCPPVPPVRDTAP